MTNTNTNTSVNNYQFEDIAKLCEISRLCESYNVTAGDGDIDSCLEEYNQLYTIWVNGMNNNIFISEEEEGYCIAFIERVLYDSVSKGITKLSDVIKNYS